MTNQRLLVVIWTLVAFALVLGAIRGWQVFHPHRSHDQKILIEKTKK